MHRGPVVLPMAWRPACREGQAEAPGKASSAGDGARLASVLAPGLGLGQPGNHASLRAAETWAGVRANVASSWQLVHRVQPPGSLKVALGAEDVDFATGVKAEQGEPWRR